MKHYDNEIEKNLLNKLIISDLQGYAFYFESPKFTIEKYNGCEKVNNEKKINENTNFRLASVTKQFIAYSVILLIEDKKISLRDNLYDIFDDMPDYTKNITIKNLLNHTSGIYDYENMEYDGFQIKDIEVLEFVKKQKGTYFRPGEKCQYSNTAYIILGLIIEKISKNSINEFIKNNIFNKLDMSDSYVNIQGKTIISNRAYGTKLENNLLIEEDQGWTTATIGDGGIYSSVNDLKKWINEISKKENLNNKMFKTNYLYNGENIKFGYGVRVVKFKNYKLIYHLGETIGTNTVIGFIPKLKIKFIFLTNLNGIDTEIFIYNLIDFLKIEV